MGDNNLQKVIGKSATYSSSLTEKQNHHEASVSDEYDFGKHEKPEDHPEIKNLFYK